MSLLALRRPSTLGLVVLSGLLSPGVGAQAPQPTGISWIDWAAEQIDFAVQEAVPAESRVNPIVPAPSMAPTGVEGGTPPPTHSIESVEIARLREEIQYLRDLIEQGVIGRVITLENEVRALRGALQQQQIAAHGGGRLIPQPGMATGVLPNTPLPGAMSLPGAADTAAAPPQPEPEPEAMLPPDPFAFTVVDEWGRSPEVVAELGGNASTLIGVAGVVPPRSAQEDVAGLAQQLRAEYDAYDNINIEIFDTEAAAQAYAERQFVDSEHHVASISRHKASGRDLILYLDGPSPVAIPLPEE